MIEHLDPPGEEDDYQKKLKDIDNLRLTQMNEEIFAHLQDPDEAEEEAEITATMAGMRETQALFTNTRVTKVDGAKPTVLEDFERLNLVGKGAFGKVYKVKHKASGEIFAMKTIRKDHVIDKACIDALKTEMDILEKMEHPFLVSTQYVFNDQYRVFFMMDFIDGGNLFRHLLKVKRFDERSTVFIVAQVAMALGHLHSQNFVYRDIKPENVLFRNDGYILLADFGLAKQIDPDIGHTTSFGGTAPYLAPEMLSGKGHDKTLDWWTLGILLYEMMYGIPPFFDKNRSLMYKMIHLSDVPFPESRGRRKIEISAEGKDLITKLLMKNPRERLGCSGGVREILEHPFFEGLDLARLLTFDLPPPYNPEIKGDEFFHPKLMAETNLDDTIMDEQSKRIVSNATVFNDPFANFAKNNAKCGGKKPQSLADARKAKE